jgi:hypothetical protein
MGGLRAEFAAGTETPHPSHRKKQALPAVHPNSKPWGVGASGNGTSIGGPANWEEFTQWQWCTVRDRPPRFPF